MVVAELPYTCIGVNSDVLCHTLSFTTVSLSNPLISAYIIAYILHVAAVYLY